VTESRVRIAVVGLGYIAREVHLPALRSLPGVEVVGLVDTEPAALARGLAESGFGPGFPSLEALLDRVRPDAALVLTPKQFHHAAVRTLLQAGVDVFCEKPLTMRLPEAEEVVRLAGDRGRVLMVGFNRRYAPVYERAREIFADRPPEACLAMKNRPGTEYRATFENAIHMVDLLRWFCGEAVLVQGVAQWTDPYYETSAAATFRFDSGAVASLLANRSTSHWVERLEAFGHGASAVVDAPDRVAVGRDNRALVTEMTSVHMGWAHVADKMGFRPELAHFVDCVRTRREPRTSGADAMRTQALMDRLLEAIGLPTRGKEDGDHAVPPPAGPGGVLQ
jgi:virulence factor